MLQSSARVPFPPSFGGVVESGQAQCRAPPAPLSLPQFASCVILEGASFSRGSILWDQWN